MRSCYNIIISAVLLAALLLAPSAAPAAPASVPAQAQTAASIQPVAQAAHASTTAALSADAASITATGTYSYTVKLFPATGADSISARFELLGSTGNSIFWRTNYWTFDAGDNGAGSAKASSGSGQEQPAADGSYSYTFTRDVSSLKLPPGAYHVNCTIRTSLPRGMETLQLTSWLIIYSPDIPPFTAAVVLRIGAPALRRTDGVFASDPATGTALARADEIGRLARWVLANSQARLAIAPSPLLLEELADIADGCSYVNRGGADTPIKLEATSAAATRVAQDLAALKSAYATGRLDVLWQGYGDPDVTRLLSCHREADLSAQYQEGAKAIHAVLGADPVPITAPYGDQTVTGALNTLKPLGVDQVLTPSADRISRSLETSSAIDAQATLFDHRPEGQNQEMAIGLVAELPLLEKAADALLDRVEALQSCEWLCLGLPSQVGIRTISNRNMPTLPQLPALGATQREYQAVVQASQAAAGLVSATGAANVTAREATRLSLIAENAYGPAPAQASSDVEDYASATLRVVRQVFSALSLRVRPVTLAGNGGDVPVTVANAGDAQVQVCLEFSSEDKSLEVTPTQSPLLTLAKNETLFSPHVNLRNVGTNKLRVKLMAGSYVICEDSVAISSSYLDIIGFVAIVVIAGAVLVIYIWRHSKKLQKGEACAS